ncbi:MAG TPA: arginine--tRNA ligase [archaeon]|nr:arginine--tRNA ligase [archaeon]
MINEFKEELLKAISKAGISQESANNLLETPMQRQMGDFALPCFKLSSQMKKAPQQIAQELSQKIVLPKSFEKSQVAGAYLNFFLDEKIIAKKIIEMAQKNPKKSAAKEKVIVEYCQANPMKAFHIGHVRNICIGESLSRILEERSKKVIRIDYGGDVGPHVSKTLYAYRNLEHRDEPKDFSEKEKWLGELYSAGAKEVKENPELEQKMREMVVELEGGKNKQLTSDWKYLRQMSIKCFELIFSEMGIKFDRIILESEVEKEGIEIAKKLEKVGFALKDQGAIIVDLQKYNLAKFLILKSDGAALYSSKDLALAKLKKEKYNPTISYNVVGAEQTFYFEQLIKTIELLNGKKNEYCKTEHISYELVRLEGGKMSSREGNVITYRELFETVYEKTFQETKERHEDWEKKKTEKIARQIAMGAIKFGMLNHDKNKVIAFNWESAIRLDGETGPFVQYSYVRANSILKKAKAQKKSPTGTFESESEKELASLLLRYETALEDAHKNMSPNKMATYLVHLAKSFNSFYQQVPVLNAENEKIKLRLALVRASAKTIAKAMNILNIEAPQEM